MLIRILSDNPGPTFTRGFDKSFVGAVKETLKTAKDPSVQQLLRETLDSLESEKQNDEGVQPLLQMWRKEKGTSASLTQSAGSRRSQAYNQPQGFGRGFGYQGNGSHHGGGGGGNQLPPPAELASRVEEARNTAKILVQLIQSTPAEDFIGNDLLREFSDRCQTAQRSMQVYINSADPGPDHDTMQTLIETNEQLSLAMSRHQRAMLSARRALGATPSPNPEPTNAYSGGAFASPPASAQLPTSGYRNTSQNQVPSTRINGYEGHGSYVPPRNNNQVNNYAVYQNEMDGSQSVPAPSVNMFNSFAGRDTRTTTTNTGVVPVQQRQPQPQLATTSDPFADPVDNDPDHPAPLAIEPTNYGPHHPKYQTPHSFTIDAEPQYSPTVALPQRRNTYDLENAYSEPNSAAGADGPHSPSSGDRTPIYPQPQSAVSPASSPGGPSQDNWHGSERTPSFAKRQSSIISNNGPTLRPKSGEDSAAQMENRTDATRRTTLISEAGTMNSETLSHFTVSPLESRASAIQQTPRVVDVPGTGGFKNLGPAANGGGTNSYSS